MAARRTEATGCDYKIEALLRQFITVKRPMLRDHQGQLHFGTQSFLTFLSEMPDLKDSGISWLQPRMKLLKTNNFLRGAVNFIKTEAGGANVGDLIQLNDGAELVEDILGEFAAIFDMQETMEQNLEVPTVGISTTASLFACSKDRILGISKLSAAKGKSIVSDLMRAAGTPVIEHPPSANADSDASSSSSKDVGHSKKRRKTSPRGSRNDERSRNEKRDRSLSRDRSRDRSPARRRRSSSPRRQRNRSHSPQRPKQRPVRFPHIKCRKCGGRGHDDGRDGAKCPKKLGQDKCDRCGGEGHFARVCPSHTK